MDSGFCLADKDKMHFACQSHSFLFKSPGIYTYLFDVYCVSGTVLITYTTYIYFHAYSSHEPGKEELLFLPFYG